MDENALAATSTTLALFQIERHAQRPNDRRC